MKTNNNNKNTYQTAQNKINKLVGVKPTKLKNTFKN